MAGIQTRLQQLGGDHHRRAWPGRVLLAVGLALIAGAPFLVLLAGADEALFRAVALGGAVVVGAGALVTGRALQEVSSVDLFGRGIAFAATSAVAAFALWYGGGYFEDTFVVSLLGIFLAFLAAGLLALFIYNVHDVLQPKGPPVFLAAALVSTGFALFWQADTVNLVLGFTVPGVLLAVELLRPPATAQGSS